MEDEVEVIVPKSVEEARTFVMINMEDEEIWSVVENPNADCRIWGLLSGFKINDKNRPLLMDCVNKNTFKNKPDGVEFAAWVAFMTAAERRLGPAAVEPFKFRE
jgi:hypothetical protein